MRKALEACYAAISEAYRRKDPDAVLRMRTADFHAIMPSGQIWDAATSAQYARAGFGQVETTLVLTFEIGTIDVQGDTAAAEIDQHWVRRQQKAGTVRHVDTRAHQQETWVHHGGEWLLWRVDRVAPGPWFVDGKLIDRPSPTTRARRRSSHRSPAAGSSEAALGSLVLGKPAHPVESARHEDRVVMRPKVLVPHCTPSLHLLERGQSGLLAQSAGHLPFRNLNSNRARSTKS